MADKLNVFSKVAIILDAIGEEIAPSVLKYLEPDDIRKLGVNLPKVEVASSEKKDMVLTEFMVYAGSGSHKQRQYLKSIYKRTLGLDPKFSGRPGVSPKVAALEWIDPKVIFEMIAGEHPQTIALILTYLTTPQAVSVLTDLPEETRVDVAVRMATLDELPPAIIEEIMETLSDTVLNALNKIGIVPGEKSEKVGGVKFVADLLKETDQSVAKTLMEKVMAANPDMAAQIKELMFTFEDIGKFDDVTMQAALKEIPKDKLALGLRTGSQEVKDVIFRNMSQRAGQTLREDIEGRGGVKLSDVEAAQKAVVDVIRKMGDEGKIIIGGKKSAKDAMV